MSKLQTVRTNQRWSQQAIADKSGVAVGTYRHYEQGVRNINTANLYALVGMCEALDCQLYDILEDEELIERLKSRV